MIRLLEEELTAQEHAVYKGDAMPSLLLWQNMPPWQITAQQPGLRALVGWLFLEERFERLTELVSMALEKIGAMEDRKHQHQREDHK